VTQNDDVDDVGLDASGPLDRVGRDLMSVKYVERRLWSVASYQR